MMPPPHLRTVDRRAPPLGTEEERGGKLLEEARVRAVEARRSANEREGAEEEEEEGGG